MTRVLIKTAILAAALVSWAAPAAAATISDYPAGVPANGITRSRHNLGSFGSVITTDATTEVCVFCHTPHFSSTNSPLWNKGVQTTSYDAYGDTLRGTVVGAPAGVTLACLSCHDGVNTFDTLVDTPGAGVVVEGGSDRGWVFTLPDGRSGSTLDSFDAIAASSRLSVGTNLANDHPVSVVYDASSPGSDLRPVSTIIASIDLTAELSGSAAAMYNGNLAQNRWAVGGSISDTATIADILRDGKVECASCHDPHFKNLSWDEVESAWTGAWCNDSEECTDGSFLRRVGGNTGSAICRTCHTR